MKNYAHAGLLFTCAAIAAQGCADGPPYDLELRAETLSIAGRNLHVGLEELDGDVLITNEWFPVDDGQLDVTYGAILAQGVSYRVHLFYDIDDNDECSAPPIDRAWSVSAGPVESTTVVDLGRLEQDSAGCGFFATPR